jgi:hypothetical protein
MPGQTLIRTRSFPNPLRPDRPGAAGPSHEATYNRIAGTVLERLAALCTWWHAKRAHLTRADIAVQVAAAIDRRIVTAQSLYALGAALCLINTYCSIAFIFFIQLNYARAPSFRRAARSQWRLRRARVAGSAVSARVDGARCWCRASRGPSIRPRSGSGRHDARSSHRQYRRRRQIHFGCAIRKLRSRCDSSLIGTL